MDEMNDRDCGAAVRRTARRSRARRGDEGLPRGPKADFERLLTDGDVARLMRVSISTVRRLATKGPICGRGLDLRLAEPLVIGEMRRWPRERVYALLGIGEAASAQAGAAAAV